MTINERIRYLRKEILKLNQTDFAEKVGISQRTVSWGEQSGNNVRGSTVKALCMAFHVNESWLRDGIEPMYVEQPTFCLEQFAKEHGATDPEPGKMRAYKDRIKDLRKSLDLTQEEFGKRIGVTKSSISTMESGKSNPSEQTIRSICREFGASYLWLTTGEGSTFENGHDDAALHVMVDRIMTSENERVKQIFKGLGKFTEDDWHQVDKLLDKLLSGERPGEPSEEQKRTDL